MSVIRFSIVAAMNTLRGIGKEGGLPWRLSGDMKFFKNLTTNTEVSLKKRSSNRIECIKTECGNHGEEDLPVLPRKIPTLKQPDQYHRIQRYGTATVHPLFPVSPRKMNLPDSVYVCGSIDEALILTQKEELKEKVENVFVIGGGQIYKEAIGLPECSKLYLTQVDNDVVCDTFFPSIPSVYTLTVSSLVHYYT